MIPRRIGLLTVAFISLFMVRIYNVQSSAAYVNTPWETVKRNNGVISKYSYNHAYCLLNGNEIEISIALITLGTG